MTTFPAELYELENVQALTITACLIDSLPIGIAHLGHLRRLDLRLNYLRSLPSDFSALDSLEELDLMNNHLRVIPPQLKSLKAIRLIDLGNDRTGHDREGTELEYASYGIDWPFPLCANHISWDDSIPELIRLLSNSTLLRLKLFARQCGDKQRSFQLIGSQPLWNKIHWEKPNPCPDPWPDRWIDRPPVANKDLLDKDICKCSLLHY